MGVKWKKINLLTNSYKSKSVLNKIRFAFHSYVHESSTTRLTALTAH